MKYLLALLLVLIVFAPALAEVYMYQDEAGKWHGVSSIDQVPEQYKNQAKAIEHSGTAETNIDPVTGLNNQEVARRLLGLDPAQPIKTEEQLKTELLETIEGNMAHIVGNQIDSKWQLTDYKVVAIDISGTVTPLALITLKVTASNSREGDRNFIWKLNGLYSPSSGWSVFKLNDAGQ